jgi:predicted TIM-barrel fold metal-dependent hydrolase
VARAREANDQLAGAVRAHPDRFAGFATLPAADPPAAADELERAVRELGLIGALVNSTLGSNGAKSALHATPHRKPDASVRCATM